MNMGCHKLIAGEVSCPGDWILLSALRRTEAGALFKIGGNVLESRPSEIPWLIDVVTAPMPTEGIRQTTEQRSVSPQTLAQIRQGLSVHYDHMEATRAPSKQTATQLKGRIKDQEASENAEEPVVIHRTWRKPSFVAQKVDSISYGTAIHTVLEYISLRENMDEAFIRSEVERICSVGLLTAEQADSVNCEKLARFFSTPLGGKVATGNNILREFKFSILDDGSTYSKELEGEKILLQGVVDCAVIEEDGITVVDFKTDHVARGEIQEVAERYRPQVEAYARALERIFQKKVKQACLYFFSQDQFVEIL
jgi:ATP-dependent helicase/nuclease subunit A